jgi:PIN domain nuclease of toxin-antitoxin system
MFGEAGADFVEDVLPGALLCSVNLAEVVTKLHDRGLSDDEVKIALETVDCEVVDFDRELATICGDLRKETRSLGLSLGDRACLAVARQRDIVAITTDAAWARAPAVKVKLLRGAPV